MSIRLDQEDLYSKDFLLEVPRSLEDQEPKILQRFCESSLADSPKKLSSYRSPKAFKLDLDKTLKLAGEFRNKFERLLVLGTGGSSLGSKALLEALRPRVSRHVHFVENLDATELPQLDSAALKKTGLIAISKSGNTLETLLALDHYIKLFSKAGLNLKDHFVAVCDQGSQSPLASWSLKNSVPLLNMDPLLGGRWSVTSAVGAFPLAFAGIDFSTFIGAVEKYFSEKPSKEICVFAARLAELDADAFHIHSLWFYSSRLKEIGAWWKQLWSESIGKKKGRAFVGAFALPAVGAVDQHSVLQQMVEGHNEALSGFVLVKKNFENIAVDNLTSEFATKIAFSNGKSWHELLQAQGVATRKSLQISGRPTYCLQIEDISEQSLGEFMAFWMDVTSLVGAAFEVNPFDQPGVGLGKKLLPTVI